jgi:hypothetical protein
MYTSARVGDIGPWQKKESIDNVWPEMTDYN